MEVVFGGRNSDVTLPSLEVSLSHDGWAGAWSNTKALYIPSSNLDKTS